MANPEETSQRALSVLFAAAEADPIIKVGGLGDVAGSLPQALKMYTSSQSSGDWLDIRLVIPFHPKIRDRVEDPELVASFDIPSHGGPIAAQAYQTSIGDLPVYLIDGAPFRDEEQIYNLETHKDGEKYTFFSLALLELARALNWPPDILHANDWHTAIAVQALKLCRGEDPFFARTRSVMTIHSLPFMGAGVDDALAYFDIPPARDDRLPTWGDYLPLPMGLASADFITTVSPTYARQILTPEFGCGLQDFLRSRSKDLAGILNGLDETAWNPANDPTLAENFCPESLQKRMINKQVLLQTYSLPARLDIPLIVMIGRIDQSKGVDLALDGLRQMPEIPWQAILLGTGDPRLETEAHQLETDFPDRVRAVIRFDGKLSRRMYAGGDILLMPSRYEPCGLAQMIAMRYGCLPVARATGGLCDTVKDNPSPENSTGFLFDGTTPEAIASALRRAIGAFHDRTNWEKRQAYAMQQDFSWKQSCAAYLKLYHQLQLT